MTEKKCGDCVAKCAPAAMVLISGLIRRGLRGKEPTVGTGVQRLRSYGDMQYARPREKGKRANGIRGTSVCAEQ